PTKVLVVIKSNNIIEVSCDNKEWHGNNNLFYAKLDPEHEWTKLEPRTKCSFSFKNLYYLTTYQLKVLLYCGFEKFICCISDNSGAVLGFLGFLIVVTSIALMFVLYKIYLLKRDNLESLIPFSCILATLLPVEPIAADASGLTADRERRIADEGRLFMEEFQYCLFCLFLQKRMVDILPYDYNRVFSLRPKEETVGDFCENIWEQQSSIIVMVTRVRKGNKEAKLLLWPSLDRETEIFDDYVVKIKGEENCPDTLFAGTEKEKSAERDVTHIQFTSWPDHGVPGEPGLLLKLRRRVNSFKNFFSGPIVIHCSAGVGRTGTYIGIDAMIESLEAEGRMDIYGLRVEVKQAQYVLYHTALIEYNQFGETEIPHCSDFHSTVNTLKQKDGSDPSLMEMEFQKTPKFKNWRSSNTALSEENKKKNRSSVVPYDFNRVPIRLEEDDGRGSDADDEDEYSSDEEDEMPTKYINASFLDGYWCPRSLIAAQGPLSDTVEDFLQMLLQQRARTVVMLSDCTENGQEFCSQYWYDEKKEFGEMSVEVKETETFPTYIKRSLEIQHTKRKESHTVQQYHFLKWAGNDLPANPHDLIDMLKTIRQTGGYKNSRENRGTPIVFHCNDGSSRSGVACALWNLLDSADTEKLVDIFQVAKGLRKERPGMITSPEQYQFLYAALEAAFPVQNGEVKKETASPDTVQIINEETALISAATEDQEGAASSQPTQQQTDAGVSGASVANGDTEANKETEANKDTEANKETEANKDTEAKKDTGANEASESSEQTEKPPSENATNGPTVTVEV
uniref:protein-tyrosine-phosphatase n=1 Tax=Astyanax mexicanus TaxID=7994 RepID=W5LE63_ASTMX